MNPSLSVVMPTYNGERFISAAFDSVRGQDTRGMELVIVDDGSSDRTLDIVRECAKDLPIRLVTPGRIGNWVAVANLGLQEARGEWACFLHQDDLWLPGRMTRLRAEMAQAKGALALHNSVFIGPDGRRLGPWTCPLAEGDVRSERFVERLLVQNFVAIPSPVFRRKMAMDSGGLNESLWLAADWDLWLRLGAMGPVRFVDETLSAFRVHPASQTAARPLAENEWRQQLTAVLDLHLPRWAANRKHAGAVKRAAMASVAVNSMLAAVSRGESIPVSAVLMELLGLGPLGWHRYVRDSRIVQRVRSRMKVRRCKIAAELASGAGDSHPRPQRTSESSSSGTETIAVERSHP